MFIDSSRDVLNIRYFDMNRYERAVESIIYINDHFSTGLLSINNNNKSLSIRLFNEIPALNFSLDEIKFKLIKITIDICNYFRKSEYTVDHYELISKSDLINKKIGLKKVYIQE
jgi:hypothetical protein